MTREQFEIKAMDYWFGRMEEHELAEFQTFLKENPEFQNDFETLGATWKAINEIPVPEPSEQMDVRFYEMLAQEEAHSQSLIKTWGDRLQYFFEALWRPQLVFGILLVLVGLGLGYFLGSSEQSAPPQKVVNTNSEMEKIREKLVLTLLEQPSANKRLQGISEANKIARVDESVIRALLQTLNNDPNVNVRLAAIASLTNYVDEPLVREGLVQSIVSQESPIVQVTLANLMVALQEKKSVESFKKLMREKDLDTSVKKKLEHSIRQII